MSHYHLPVSAPTERSECFVATGDMWWCKTWHSKRNWSTGFMQLGSHIFTFLSLLEVVKSPVSAGYHWTQSTWWRLRTWVKLAINALVQVFMGPEIYHVLISLIHLTKSNAYHLIYLSFLCLLFLHVYIFVCLSESPCSKQLYFHCKQAIHR